MQVEDSSLGHCGRIRTGHSLLNGHKSRNGVQATHAQRGPSATCRKDDKS